MKTWQKILAAVFGLLVLVAVIVLVAQGPPTITKTKTVTLDVQPAPDFTLDVTPASIVTPVNRTVAYNVVCTAVNNFAGVIRITVAGLPTGATATFFPSDTFTLGATPAGPQVNVVVPNDPAIVRVWTLTFTATSSSYN